MISGILFYKCGYHLLEGDIKEILLLRNQKVKKYVNIKKSNETSIKEKKKKKNGKKNTNKNTIIKTTKNKNKKNKRMRINLSNIKDKSIPKSTSKLYYSSRIKKINNKTVLNALIHKSKFIKFQKLIIIYLNIYIFFKILGDGIY